MKSGGRIIFNPIGTDLLISQDSIDKQQGYPVIKASQLVQKARHQLTAKELKLIDFMVSKVRRDDSGFRPLQTTIKEINQVMEFGRGTKSLTETSKSLLSLSNKGFWFQKDEDTITIARWLQTAEIKKDGSATLELDEKLAPWLLKLVGSRAQYSLSDIVALRSKYSLMLYQLLMSWRGSMGVNGTPPRGRYACRARLRRSRQSPRYSRCGRPEISSAQRARHSSIGSTKPKRQIPRLSPRAIFNASPSARPVSSTVW